MIRAQVATTGDSTQRSMESGQDQQIAHVEVRRYTVPITSHVEMQMTGLISVFAHSEDDAIAKVEDQIAGGTIEDDLEMEDWQSGFTMPFSDVDYLGDSIVIEDSRIEVGEVADRDEALEAEIEKLWAHSPADFESRLKVKAFLQSLTEMQSAAA